MAGTKLNIKECNMVHRDTIWKDHCLTEIQSKNVWNDKWGFLLEDSKGMQHQLKQLESKKLNKDSNTVISNNQKDCRASNVGTNATVTNIEDEEVKQCKMPITESQKIGWLVANGKSPLFSVEKDPRRGKRSILNQLGWPMDGIN